MDLKIARKLALYAARLYLTLLPKLVLISHLSLANKVVWAEKLRIKNKNLMHYCLVYSLIEKQ